jgi:hypothetical protein
MASFDVGNLFTNIPRFETINICLYSLFKDVNDLVMGFNRNFFESLRELSVLNSISVFAGKFYRQIDGLGMGLPLGRTFANIFMCFHEATWLANCPLDSKPIFYNRYVVVNNLDKISSLPGVHTRIISEFSEHPCEYACKYSTDLLIIQRAIID